MPVTARSRALLQVALAVAVPLSSGTATAAGSTRGVLTGDTAIRWTGKAGIVLSTRGTGTLPDGSMQLYVDGGTYAFVTMLVDPQPAACASNAGQRHCYGFSLSLFPHSGTVVSAARRGDDHVTQASRPPNLVGRRLVTYLFTDGRATLRLRPTGYRGRSSYVANGVIHGGVRLLPDSCAAIPCVSNAAATVGGGGLTFDFGARPTHVQTFAYTVATKYRDDPTGGNRPMNVQSCVYPNDPHPDSSPEARDHPYGCDVVPSEPGRADRSVADNMNGTRFAIAGLQQWIIGDVTGRRYAGFHSDATPSDGVFRRGYAWWFNYGVR